MLNENEGWMAKNWRPLCGMVYLAICLLDFAIMPVWYTYLTSQFGPERLLEFATKLAPGQQIEALRLLRAEMVWKPVTLDGSGLFHMSFGAILGLTAWTRGQEKTERVRAEVAIAQIVPPTVTANNTPTVTVAPVPPVPPVNTAT